MHIHIRSKSFGNNPVLRDVELTLDTNSRIAITGASGAGKTTLLRIIAGLDNHFEGAIKDAPEAIGIVFQEPFLMNWKTAEDNLILVTGCSPESAQSWLAQMGLTGMEHRLPQELSIGQQRRVSLARAFSANPKLLILDEAFASLDENTAQDMRKLVAQYIETQHCGLIMVTHEPEDLTLAKDSYILQDAELKKI